MDVSLIDIKHWKQEDTTFTVTSGMDYGYSISIQNQINAARFQLRLTVLHIFKWIMIMIATIILISIFDKPKINGYYYTVHQHNRVTIEN